MFIQMLTYNYL